MTKQNQKGFSVFEACIIVLVLVLLAVGAWFIWDKNKDKNYEESANAAMQVEDVEEDAIPEQTYLTIKEWGVRFKLSADNADGYYFIEQGKPNYAYLSLTSLKDVDHCGADDTTTGVYARFTVDEKDPIREEMLLIDEYPSAKKVGNYYFYFERPQASCSEDETTQAKADAARQAFSANTGSVEAIPAN